MIQDEVSAPAESSLAEGASTLLLGFFIAWTCWIANCPHGQRTWPARVRSSDFRRGNQCAAQSDWGEAKLFIRSSIS
jgi:hypothetical protein